MSCEVADDILFIRLSEEKITKEISQDWNTRISYAQDGTIVEVVVLEASKQGVWPLLRQSGGIKAALTVEQHLISLLVQKFQGQSAKKSRSQGACPCRAIR